MKIDPNKKYQTRNGKLVTLLHRLPEGWPTEYPIIGVVGGGKMSWTEEGKEDLSSEIDEPEDLIEVHEPLEVQLVVDSKGEVFTGKRQAAWYDSTIPDRAPFRIATFREVLP